MKRKPHGPVAESADAADLKSAFPKGEWGFESPRAYLVGGLRSVVKWLAG